MRSRANRFAVKALLAAGALCAAEAPEQFQVFVFLSPGCPLSQRYVAELRGLTARFPESRVLWRVMSESDPALAARMGARVTPSAAVIDSKGSVLYRGRIDDRAAAIGVFRSKAAREDLAAALSELLAGRRVSVPETAAAGCAIPVPAKRSTRLTYWKHARPILSAHCVECHRPGASGPFRLDTFAQASLRATAIAAAAASRRMPPWKAQPGPPHFAGERRLSAHEIATLSEWAAGGAPEGNAPPGAGEADATAVGSWKLGEPQHRVITPAFRISAGGADLYQCFVVSAGVSGDRFVRAFEFRPGEPRAIHHALIFVDNSGAARRRDAETPEPGYPCFGVPGFLPSSALGGWAPGTGAVEYPAGGAVTLRKTSDLVIQLHAAPIGEERTDVSTIALYFSERPPTRRMMDVALGSRDIDIAPGDQAYRVKDRFTLPVDVTATGIIPHAHFLCRTMRGWATLPGGKRIKLLTISDWDFNWQTQYRYRTPFVLPAGTQVEMEFVYDNSAANPRNPNSPPRRVVWGPDSADEMAGLHLQVMPVRNEDAEELGRALWGKLMRSLRRESTAPSRSPGAEPLP